MPHPDDEMLAALASGEPVPAEVSDHVDHCATCSEDIAAVRHVLDAARSVEAVPSWDPPPARVWDAVVAELDAPVGDQQPARPETAGLHSVSATSTAVTSRPVAAQGRSPRRRGRDRRLVRWTVAAAAAGLVFGVLGSRLAGQLPRSQSQTQSQSQTVSSASLDALDTQQRVGDAEVLRADDGLTLRIQTTPLEAPRDGYLEVWLINTDKKRMVSVGILASGERSASFPIQSDLLQQGYTIVDISREPLDDNPQHSGDSIVRGQLPA